MNKSCYMSYKNNKPMFFENLSQTNKHLKKQFNKNIYDKNCKIYPCDKNGDMTTFPIKLFPIPYLYLHPNKSNDYITSNTNEYILVDNSDDNYNYDYDDYDDDYDDNYDDADNEYQYDTR